MTRPVPRLRRSPSMATRTIDGSAVVVVPETQAMHTLNEVGTFVWENCDGRTLNQVVRAVMREFDVDEPTARRDVESFVKTLVERRMLTIE